MRKRKSWFLYHHITPTLSPLMDISQFTSTAQDWQTYFNRSAAPVAEEDESQIDITADVDFMRTIYQPQYYKHLQKERTSQIVMAEFTRRGGGSSDKPRKASSTAAMSEHIPQLASNVVDDDAECAEVMDTAFEEVQLEKLLQAVMPTGLYDIDYSQVDKLVDECFAVVDQDQQQQQQQQEQTNINASSNSKEFREFCAYLSAVKLSLQYPKLNSLRNRNLIGKRDRKCLEVGLPIGGFIDSPAIPNNNNEQTSSVQPAILTVGVFSTHRPFTKQQEFMVRSDSLLSDFRKTIYCVSDCWTPERLQRKSSGFLLIENTFYNDMSEGSLDYSANFIEEWSKTNNQKQCPYKKANMKSTRWKDLSVRVNFPYLYCHQGDCYHTIMITSMSSFNPTRHSASQETPILLFQKQPASFLCRFCSEYPSQKFVFGNEEPGSFPAIFCDKCFTKFYGNNNNAGIVLPVRSDIPRVI